jgi:hypothetical protein
MKKTPYYKLAERIAKNINGVWYCCNDLPVDYADTFEFVYRPSPKEEREYRHYNGGWMGEICAPIQQDNNLRILALLFMHELTINP